MATTTWLLFIPDCTLLSVLLGVSSAVLTPLYFLPHLLLPMPPKTATKLNSLLSSSLSPGGGCSPYTPYGWMMPVPISK